MKKICFAMFVLIGIGCLLFLVTRQVVAAPGDIGEGVWLLPESANSVGTVNLDLEAATAPEWLQQLSEGVVIDQAEKICYPFRGGQFHWVPQILQYRNETWQKVETTQELLDGTEAIPYACAQTTMGGTFVLFGYYNGPTERFVEPTEEPTPIGCPSGFVLVGETCQPIPKKNQ